MEKNDYLSSLHEELLSILDQVTKVCDSNQLKYYLIGGSLLGAVRHKGFIPWDDDLDIVMPREDFEKFVSCVYKQLDNGYSMEWINTNPRYNKVFAKVCKDHTLFEEAVGEMRTSHLPVSVSALVLTFFLLQEALTVTVFPDSALPKMAAEVCCCRTMLSPITGGSVILASSIAVTDRAMESMSSFFIISYLFSPSGTRIPNNLCRIAAPWDFFGRHSLLLHRKRR